MKVIAKFVVILTAVASMGVFASGSGASMEERIKPVAKVCMAGDDCAAAPVAAAAAEPRSGKAVFTSKCSTCHATGAAGSPKFGDSAAWAPRISKGLDALYVSALNGFNGMPAKGLCFDCSEDEIKAAVNYMTDAAK